MQHGRVLEPMLSQKMPGLLKLLKHSLKYLPNVKTALLMKKHLMLSGVVSFLLMVKII